MTKDNIIDHNKQSSPNIPKIITFVFSFVVVCPGFSWTILCQILVQVPELCSAIEAVKVGLSQVTDQHLELLFGIKFTLLLLLLLFLFLIFFLFLALRPEPGFSGAVYVLLRVQLLANFLTLVDVRLDQMLTSFFGQLSSVLLGAWTLVLQCFPESALYVPLADGLLLLGQILENSLAADSPSAHFHFDGDGGRSPGSRRLAQTLTWKENMRIVLILTSCTNE